jgi:hypothetical protein
MAWVETASPSFVARHDSAQADDAGRVLEDLESFRETLEEEFESVPREVAVVIHPRPLMLDLAAPWLPLARAVSAPAGRRYFAGWFTRKEVHVLAPEALEQRASGSAGSREALLRSPRHEYAHIVLGANNPSLPPPFGPRTFRRYVRMAWLCEGAATWLAGQVPHLRPAIARRLREGGRPAFPPDPRDAMVLGGTVFAMLEREAGREACAELARMTEGKGSRQAVEAAFGRPAAAVQRGWVDYLTALTTTG